MKLGYQLVRFSSHSSFQCRLKFITRATSLLNIALILEGIGTLLWIWMVPSEPANRIFLAYSLERWGLIVFTFILVSLLVYLLWAARSRREWIGTAIGYFADEQRAAGLLAAFTFIVLSAFAIHFGLLFNERLQAYYRQFLPLLAFMTLTIVQVWVFLLVILPHARARMSEAWFPAYQEDYFPLKANDKRLFVVLIGISLAYLFVQIGAAMRVPQAVELGDTTSYLEGAGMPLSDPAFFSERRPWGILLIYKVLGVSLTAIGFAQLAFSTFAWLFLAWILVGSLRSSAVKILGHVFVLGISLSPTVQAWNHAGLSESFSISVLILILALLMGLLQRWRLFFFLPLVFFFALWVSIYEAHLYLGLLIAITLFLLGLIKKNYRTFLILSFCIASMLGINYHLSSLYALPRWALPVAEVITKRILPVPEYREYFSSQGMPLSPELMALSGRWAHSDNYAILNHPRLRPFSRWLFRDGRTIYTRFLITHPIYTLTLPWLNINEMLAADFSHLIPAYRPALPAMINEFFFPIRWFWVYLGISLLLFVFILWKLRKEKSRVFWLIALFFVFSIPSLYLAWHADALDLARHAAIANVQFHLGMGLLVLFYLDKQVAMQVSVKW